MPVLMAQQEYTKTVAIDFAELLEMHSISVPYWLLANIVFKSVSVSIGYAHFPAITYCSHYVNFVK